MISEICIKICKFVLNVSYNTIQYHLNVTYLCILSQQTNSEMIFLAKNADAKKLAHEYTVNY